MRLDTSSPHLCNPTYIDLTRLLARLDHKLSSLPSSAGKTSSYGTTSQPVQLSQLEHIKLQANIDYAKRLLLQLEHDVGGFKAAQRVQVDLMHQRDVVKGLEEKMGEVVVGGGLFDEDDDEEDKEEPEGVKEIEGTVLDGGRREGQGQDGTRQMQEQVQDRMDEMKVVDETQMEAEPSIAMSSEGISGTKGSTSTPITSSLSAPRQSESTSIQDSSTANLRNRFPTTTVPSTSTPTSTTIPTATSTSLFGSRSNKSTTTTTSTSNNNNNAGTLPTTSSPPSTSDLTHHDLTSSLLSMAQQLKANSNLFAASLEAEKPLLDDAARGLDKSASGMEGTSKKMGDLEGSQNVTFFYQIKVFIALIGLALCGLMILWVPRFGR